MRDDASFGYRICREEGGWTWTTFDLAGEVLLKGHAPTKAVAAACVIRALARSVLPSEAAQAA
ncbi:hypothetical protein [Phenylobacterium sp.]|jgi:hypothetical protein|uniref:hypothetical protein n=1 Tax=Phenylobacterium sp. TaxID=1871053 RepID=UPI002F92D9A8